MKKNLVYVKIEIEDDNQKHGARLFLFLFYQSCSLMSTSKEGKTMEIHSSIANLTNVIYIIIHRKTGCCYVGQTAQKLKMRISEHLNGDKQFIDRVIRIEGKNNFEVGILDICNSPSALNERERYWIGYFKCKRPRGFNVIDGGKDLNIYKQQSKPVICIETNERFGSIAEAAIKLNVSASKISEVCNGKRKTTGGLNFVFANTPIEERKIFRTQKRRIICIETGIEYDSISEAAYKLGMCSASIGNVCRGKQGSAGGLHFIFSDIPTEEQKVFKYQPNSRRRVRCVETGMEYESIAEAARQTGFLNSKIGEVCNGNRKTTGRLHFIFVSKDVNSTDAL